jgi:hypothetical protein
VAAEEDLGGGRCRQTFPAEEPARRGVLTVKYAGRDRIRPDDRRLTKVDLSTRPAADFVIPAGLLVIVVPLSRTVRPCHGTAECGGPLPVLHSLISGSITCAMRTEQTAHDVLPGRMSARQRYFEPVSGFEPLTCRLQGGRSAC